MKPTKIKFGTDGWRAIIAKEYTIHNVRRVAEATARWMQERDLTKVVIGHDCRFNGHLFSYAAAEVFTAFGIQVFRHTSIATTPMVSLGVTKLNADLGVVITASHNPPSYNGFKLKSKEGGPMIPKHIAEVEALIPDEPMIDESKEEVDPSFIETVNLEDIYYDHVMENFDIQGIMDANLQVAYDAMYGAGQIIFTRILPTTLRVNCSINPGFNGQAPEPIDRNLKVLSALIQRVPDIAGGIATDGDADRIGMYDEHGKFIDSHHLLLLLLYYMYEVKKMSGKVVVTFSVTEKMRKLAEMYNLEFEVTKIGFKYIAEIMLDEDVLVGGEESGGLAIKGHIPERDGIWIGLTILELMAKTGKKLSELVELIHDKVGAFFFDRDDLHLEESRKQAIIEMCKAGGFDNIGSLEISNVETIDGFKYYFGEGEWVMIRPSGTEPVLRVYAQAANETRTREILDITHQFFQS